MKIFKPLFLISIILLFAVGCVVDGGVYAHDVHGTIYDNRYTAHYDPYYNYSHYNNRDRRYRHHHDSSLRIDFSTNRAGIHIRQRHNSYGTHGYKHCRYVLREDYDPYNNRRVVRRYRVCR
jgi:hypothetical protein